VQFSELLEKELDSMKGFVLNSEEVTLLRESLQIFKFAVEPNVTWFLESMSRHRVVVGFCLARAERILREENLKFNKFFARKYIANRDGGLNSKIGKAPPQEALKWIVTGDVELLEQQTVCSRAEYHRDLLKELHGALATKSREVDQLANNMRLEIRADLLDPKE